MKKLIAVMLLISVVLSSFGINAFAVENKNDDPIILISGFLCSKLYKDYGTEDEEKVWMIDFRRITDRVSEDLPRVFKDFAGLAVGKTESFTENLSDGIADVLEYLRCNPDGSSVYPISHYPNYPATSNLRYMFDNGETENVYEKNFCRYLSKLADPSKIYCFQYDSRFDAITIAEELNLFIEQVKEYTNSDKVRIFALSFGGLISSTYLYLHGNESVSKLIMSVPALGGTNIPDRLFRGKIEFPIETLIMFFETVLAGEGNFARIFEKNTLKRINGLVSSSVDGVFDALGCWGSIWSLCSIDLYDKLKDDFLDPVKNAAIIEKTDRIHYEIMPAIPEMLRNAMESGTDVAVLCGTGSPIVTGGTLNGDVILPASFVSGATCLPIGRRFPNGYTGVKTTCSNPEHNHISPSMEVDASSAYLPENTWFIENQYHGQYFYEEYTRSLVTKLLLTDEIKDVYSDSDYPQFEYSNHSYRTVYASFDNSPTGYLTSKDSVLTVENLSESNYIKILSVVSDGVELEFDVSDAGMLSPSEIAEIPFEGDVPKVGATAARITVSYIEFGSPTPFCVSDFDIMIDNGDAVSDFTDRTENIFVSKLQSVLPEKVYDFIVRFSMRQLVESVYNSISSLI